MRERGERMSMSMRMRMELVNEKHLVKCELIIFTYPKVKKRIGIMESGKSR